MGATLFLRELILEGTWGGLDLGASPDSVVDRLGEPTDRSTSDHPILKYGPLQLSFYEDRLIRIGYYRRDSSAADASGEDGVPFATLELGAWLLAEGVETTCDPDLSYDDQLALVVPGSGTALFFEDGRLRAVMRSAPEPEAGGSDPDEPIPALTIGLIVDSGGPGAAWEQPVKALMRHVSRSAHGVKAPLHLNIVFEIAGNSHTVEFEGLRTAGYSSKNNEVMVQVAMPDEVPELVGPAVIALADAAIDEAEVWAARRGIARSLNALRDLLPRARSSFLVFGARETDLDLVCGQITAVLETQWSAHTSDYWGYYYRAGLLGGEELEVKANMDPEGELTEPTHPELATLVFVNHTLRPDELAAQLSAIDGLELISRDEVP